MGRKRNVQKDRRAEGTRLVIKVRKKDMHRVLRARVLNINWGMVMVGRKASQMN